MTGAGVDALLDTVFEVLRLRVAGLGVASHARQADALADAVTALTIPPALPPEVKMEMLREATHHLERLVGRIDVEDYLGQVFSTFCVGK